MTFLLRRFLARSLLTRAFITLICIISILYIILVITINLFNINTYRDDIIRMTAEATGRKLSIDGELSLSLSLFSLSPTLSIQSLSLSNSAWSSTDDMLNIENAEIQVGALGLLHPQPFIDIKHAFIFGIQVSLEQNSDGLTNWVLDNSLPHNISNNNSADMTTNIRLRKLLMQNLDLTYTDQTTIISKITVSQFTITESAKSRLSLSLAADIQANDMTLNNILINGTIGNIDTLFAKSLLPLNLNISLLGVDSLISGFISNPMDNMQFNLEVNTRADDLGPLQNFLSNDLRIFQPLRFSSTITNFNSAFQFKNILVKSGTTNLSGNFNVDITGQKPMLLAQLNIPSFDFKPFQGDDNTSDSTMFNTHPLPFDTLNIANAEIELSIGLLSTTNADFSKLTTDISLHDGLLNISPFTADIGEGQLDLQLSLDNSNNIHSPHLKLTLNAKDIPLEALPDINPFIQKSHSDIFIDLTSHGLSMAELASNSNGSALVDIGEGEFTKNTQSDDGSFISKLTLLLNPLTTNNIAKRRLECIIINLNIDDGIVIANNSIGIQSSIVELIANGEINLASEAINFTLQSSATDNAGFTLDSLVALANIQGTLSAPTFGTDFKNVASTGIHLGTSVAKLGFNSLKNGFTSSGNIKETTPSTSPCIIALNTPSSDIHQIENNQISDEGKPKLLQKIRGVFGPE